MLESRVRPGRVSPAQRRDNDAQARDRISIRALAGRNRRLLHSSARAIDKNSVRDTPADRPDRFQSLSEMQLPLIPVGANAAASVQSDCANWPTPNRALRLAREIEFLR